MPATAAVIAVAAAGTTYGAVSANQQAQHAKGAAQAEQQQLDNQAKSATAADDANKKQQGNTGSATRDAAIAALKASMVASNGGSILTSPTGSTPGQTQTKTLLGL